MTWTCYWMEPTMEAEVGLRRFVYTTKEGGMCPGSITGGHNAHVFLDECVAVSIKESEDGYKSWDYTVGDLHDHNDPRWPVKCDACDYEFTDDDEWQLWHEPLYRRADNGELRVLHWSMTPSHAPTAEPGAMWHNWWIPTDLTGPGPLTLNPDRPKDGIVLEVRCPYLDDRINKGGQDWCVDRASTGSGGFWTRTGDPRNPPSLTVSPSIAIGHPGHSGYYHGFLQAGILTDHLG